MYRMPFGKHQGRSLMDVVMDDPDYCDWLLAQTWFGEKYPTLRATLAAMRTGDRVISDESVHTIAEPPPRRRSSRRIGRQQLSEAMQVNAAFLAPPEVLDGGCTVYRPSFAQRAQ